MEAYEHDIPTRILVVEDDHDTCRWIEECLGPHHRVTATATGRDALFACRQVPFHLVLLDVRLPDITGIELAHALQEIRPGLPIVIMTAHPMLPYTVEDMVDLNIAGYLAKPLSVAKLVEKVKVVLAQIRQEQRLQMDDLIIDCVARQVMRDGQWLLLSRQEVDVLICLARAGRDGQIVRHEELIQAVWGCDPSPADIGLVRVTISRLRQKLNDDAGRPRYIESVRGAGYRVVQGADREQM